MKRRYSIIGSLACALVMSLALAGVALANEGPHGGYGGGANQGVWSGTDGCAACHRAHVALNTNLLYTTSITQLCQNCHGVATLGADTDVWDGKFVSSGGAGYGDSGYLSTNTVGGGLNGGGFLQAFSVNAATMAAVSSMHTVDGFGGSPGTGTAYGGGVPANGYTGPSGTLECTSCHDPHGSSNYRILTNFKAHGYEAKPWVTTDNLAWGIAPVGSNEVTPSGVGGAPAHNYTAGNHVAYDRGISDFCAACHTNYVTGFAGTAGQQYFAPDSASFATRYRHAVSMKQVWDPTKSTWIANSSYYANNSWVTPGSGNGNGAIYGLRRVASDGLNTDGTNITCLTCHRAHGSSATVSTAASSAAEYGTGSSLLYLSNRGVCEQCHQK